MDTFNTVQKLPTGFDVSEKASQFRDIRIENNLFADKRELLENLVQIVSPWREKTVVMAGHYILFYRYSTDELVPLMKSTVHKEDRAEQEYVKDVADFPVATFEMGVQLIARCHQTPMKLALLVNDRQLRLFQDNLPSEDRLQELRRRYYHETNELPEAFRDILLQYPEVVDPMEQNDAQRTNQDTLLSKTFFFSDGSSCSKYH